MVSTHPVHDGEDLESLRLAVTTEDVESVQRVDPTVPSEVDAWIMRLLRRQVEERTPAVMEIQSKVDLALQALPTRPSEAEVAAYLRQLFTARMPELPEEQAEDPDRREVEVAESPVEETTSEAPSRHWWWIAAALVTLALVVYLLWGRGPGGSAPAQDEPDPAVPAAVEPAPGEMPNVEASTGTAPPEPSPTATEAATARPPEPAAPRQEDLDVAGLVAEEFARRQRDLDQRLRALEEAQAAQSAAAAGDTPPAEEEEPPTGDGGGPPAALQ
jgi:hypothetical protein